MIFSLINSFSKGFLLLILFIIGLVIAQSCQPFVTIFNRNSVDKVTITVLETTDIHTRIYPWNYFTGEVDETVGLAKVATLIQKERRQHPETTLLIDDGDIIQGTPLGSYYAVVDNQPPHPMAVAMNAIHYDAAVLGNHEFNYGLDVLNKFIAEVNFPVLGANVRLPNGEEAYPPYLIKEIKGIKIGILGLVTPRVDVWDSRNIQGKLSFKELIPTTQDYVNRLKQAGVDIIIIAAHSGPDQFPDNSQTPEAWQTNRSTWDDLGSLPGENQVIQIAESIPEITAILSGHTHKPIANMIVNDVVILQPNCWGSHLGKLTIDLQKQQNQWTITNINSTILAVDTVEADKGILEKIRPYHQQVLQYIKTPIGSTVDVFRGGDRARYTDSPLADLINTVQIEAAKQAGYDVDISLAAIFTEDDPIFPVGTITLQEAFKGYLYDNTLWIMEINGDILRGALEQMATQYFNQISLENIPDSGNPNRSGKGSTENNPELIAKTARGYNWDLYSGIDYTIDISQPPGKRVTRLEFNGKPVQPNQTFLIAINNYRGSGGGGFEMFKSGKILYQSPDSVRDYLVQYIREHPNLNPQQISKCNFKLQPDLYQAYFGDEPTLCSNL